MEEGQAIQLSSRSGDLRRPAKMVVHVECVQIQPGVSPLRLTVGLHHEDSVVDPWFTCLLVINTTNHRREE